MNPPQILALTTLLISAPAFPHGTTRGMVMLLPTAHYQLGATLAVAASFLLLAAAANLHLTPKKSAFAVAARHASGLPSWLSFAMLLSSGLAGLVGDTDPLANPLPLLVWTLWWVGFTLLQCVFGDMWRWCNPWRAPLHLARRLIAKRKPPPALQRLAYAPACVLFFAFAWFELVHPAPDNPQLLARVVLGYWAFTFVACCLFGEKYWLRYAEPFSVFFRLIGGCAPLVHRVVAGRRYYLPCLPGRALTRLPPLPLSGAMFVLLTLSSVSFDGINKTFAYLSLLGVNPLQFPGRNAVLFGNSIGLLCAWFALAALFFVCVYCGCALARRRDLFAPSCGRLVYSLLPISLVFHFAHYLGAFITQTQYAWRAAGDPFARGWNLFGASDYVVSASHLTHYASVSAIWVLQTFGIVIGHVIGIAIAHRIAVRLFADAAARSQIFLAALMVFYTWFGLWLLATPAVG